MSPVDGAPVHSQQRLHSTGFPPHFAVEDSPLSPHDADDADFPILLGAPPTVQCASRSNFASRALLGRLCSAPDAHLWASFLPEPLRRGKVAASLRRSEVLAAAGVADPETDSAEQRRSTTHSHHQSGAALPDAALDDELGQTTLLDPVSTTSQVRVNAASAAFANVLGRVWFSSQDPVGCREVQLALELAHDTVPHAIGQELAGHVRKAMRRPHANHVLEKFITVSRPEDSQFIVDEIMERSSILTQSVRHRYGCRVIQHLLQHCRPEQLDTLAERLLSDALALLRHPFGNFVMQHLLKHGTRDQRSRLAHVLLVNCETVATDAAGVVALTCALEQATSTERLGLALALLQAPGLLLRIAFVCKGDALVKAVFDVVHNSDSEHALAMLWQHRGDLSRSRSGRTVLEEVAARIVHTGGA